jgi:polyphenol oxidase
VLTDRAGTRIGVAHAGWRGLAAGVLEATITALDVDPGELLAWMGPAIGPDAFEVGGEVRAAFIERDPANVVAFAANAAGRYQADIYALARQAMLRAGVQHVGVAGVCTSSDPQNYFSYRRDRVTGRMATLAWIDRPC